MTDFDADKFTVENLGSEQRLICRDTLLPAYDSRQDFNRICAKYFPQLAVETFWRCRYCGKYHNAGYFPRGSNNKHMRKETTIKEAMQNEI